MMIRMDTGPGFVTEALAEWGERNGVLLPFISKGSLQSNSLFERLDRSFRKNFLDCCLLEALGEVRDVAWEWRIAYNKKRPHNGLDDMAPLEYRQKYASQGGTCYELIPVGEGATLHAQMQCIYCLRRRQGTSCSKLTCQLENTFESLKNPAHELESRTWLGITRGSLRRIFVLDPAARIGCSGLDSQAIFSRRNAYRPAKNSGPVRKKQKALAQTINHRSCERQAAQGSLGLGFFRRVYHTPPAAARGFRWTTPLRL